jgi:integrase
VSSIIPSDLALSITQQDVMPDYGAAVDKTLQTVSMASQRVYAETYQDWWGWCDEQQCSPFEFSRVRDFLVAQPVSYTSRKRMMSALRTLTETLMFIDHPRTAYWRNVNGLMKRVKVPQEGTVTNKRARVALQPGEADAAIDCWNEDTNKHKRNRALIAFLLATGARRSEVAKVQWSDIDLRAGTVNIIGKRDKEREASIFGEKAINALIEWRKAQGHDREYVFCGVSRHDTIHTEDKPLSGDAVFAIVKATEKLAGLDHFSPHDARRTLLTEMQEVGRPLSEAKEQAGHENEAMTLRYSLPNNARKRRKDTNLRYG